jgi:hypothetical protein
MGYIVAIIILVGVPLVARMITNWIADRQPPA